MEFAQLFPVWVTAFFVFLMGGEIVANWLVIDKMAEWDFPILTGFQYDSITDSQIASALTDEANIVLVDPSLDWEDDRWLGEQSAIPEENKHAYRVAALVRGMLAGEVMREPIELDTACTSLCLSSIQDGHHRIRALQYMGLAMGPFSLSGYLDPLEQLVSIAGTDGPGNDARFFADELLRPSVCDIRIERPTLSTGRWS